jgi:PAS domain S-box-containing protein
MDTDEDTLLRSAALQNARAVHQARQRAEEDLRRANEALSAKTRELAHSLALVRATLEATTNGILAVDGGGRVTGVNDRFVRMWRVPPGALAAGGHRDVLDAIGPAVRDPAAFRARVEEVSASARPDSTDLLHLADGQVFEQFSRVQLADGRVVGRVWTYRDITARTRAEEGVRLRDRAIQALPQGLLISDASRPDHPAVYVNPGFEALTGYPAAEVLGRNCRFLQGEDTDPAAVARVREAVATGTPATVELLNYRRDGTPFWNELSVSPVRDAAGRLTHFVGIQADVTRRRETEDRLRQAQKMEAVGRLAGGIAHDFNNLLTIINGYSELLAAGLDRGDARWDPVAAIRDAGERATGLTAQLLAFSRKTIVEPRVLDLNDLVARTVRMLGRLLGEDVAVRTAPARDVPRVKADPGQVEQVLMNLAVNARDAMPRGGVLTIGTGAVAVGPGDPRYPGLAPGRYARLTVADTGEGMSEAVRARVFEPFFTTKEVGKGTGLGLAMVFGVAQTYAGHVGVESAVGAGTTVEFLLPAAAAPAAGPSPSVEIRAAPRGHETVLLVEDEDLVRALSRTALRRLGYAVLDAAGGADALRLAAAHPDPVDLTVTDVVMPGMSGREFATALRARHPGVKVLYVSGYTDDEVLRHGVAAGTDEFLQKPYTPLSLARRVREVLDADRADKTERG